ncbi:MAG: DUF2752 domain-containing protein [Lachnospiraceae bacterium]|nr:DUF2752 domain-containing protein [Lachnospiraceae bacterium]
MKKKCKEISNRIFADVREYGWTAVVFAVYYVFVHLIKAAFCPLLQTTGIPCAGCGLTRAFLFIIRGEFSRALYIQPMAYFIIAFLLYCGFFRYIKGSRIRGFTPVFILLVLGMLVFYVIRMCIYFPDRVPYVYMKENTLAERIPLYNGWIRSLISSLRSLRGY